MPKKKEKNPFGELAREMKKMMESNPRLSRDQLIAAMMAEMFPDIQDIEEIEANDEELAKQIEANEMLEKACEAETKEEIRKYAKKALKLDPELIDAETILIDLEENPVKRSQQYEVLKKKAKKKLEVNAFLDEEEKALLEFFGVESYIRICYAYLFTLMELGGYTKAIEQGEEIIKLSEEDSMEVKELLMQMYAMLERFKEAEKLYQECKEESTISLLFPLAIIYYKKGDMKKAKEIIQKVNKANPYVFPVLIEVCCYFDMELDDVESEEYIEVGSKDEAIMVVQNNMPLIMSVPAYAHFIQDYFQNEPKSKIKRIK